MHPPTGDERVSVGNPIGCGTCSARSRSARVCAAEMQTRARALISGVAGKPTTTSATPRSQHSRDAAAILPGWNSITGCTHVGSHSLSSVFKRPARSQHSRDATAIWPGWNSITGCAHAEHTYCTGCVRDAADRAQPRRRRNLARLEKHHGLRARSLFSLHMLKSSAPGTAAGMPRALWFCLAGTASCSPDMQAH